MRPNTWWLHVELFATSWMTGNSFIIDCIMRKPLFIFPVWFSSFWIFFWGFVGAVKNHTLFNHHIQSLNNKDYSFYFVLGLIWNVIVDHWHCVLKQQALCVCVSPPLTAVLCVLQLIKTVVSPSEIEFGPLQHFLLLSSLLLVFFSLLPSFERSYAGEISSGTKSRTHTLVHQTTLGGFPLVFLALVCQFTKKVHSPHLSFMLWAQFEHV